MDTTIIIALAIIAAICAGILAWLEIKQARENMVIYDQRVKAWGEEQTRKAAEDEREHRRMVHEADLKDASLRGKANLDELLAATNGVNTDEYRRRLSAGIQNQHSASMEPFCGEGKKT